MDDVITAGTAIREALGIIRAAGGVPSGIVVALDRQEIASEQDRRSAAQAVATEAGIPVIAVANLSDLLAFAAEKRRPCGLPGTAVGLSWPLRDRHHGLTAGDRGLR